MMKKIGRGTFSMVFFILAFVSQIKIARTFCLGNIILKALGIPVWSSGYNHRGFNNSVYVMIFFLVLGVAFGILNSKDWGARLGTRLSIFFLILFVVILLATARMFS